MNHLYTRSDDKNTTTTTLLLRVVLLLRNTRSTTTSSSMNLESNESIAFSSFVHVVAARRTRKKLIDANNVVLFAPAEDLVEGSINGCVLFWGFLRLLIIDSSKYHTSS